MTIMLKNNMQPKVADRTANFLASIITGSSAASAAFYGELPVDYAIVIALMSIIATIIGLWIRELVLVKTQGRYSFLVLLLFIVIVIIFISSASLNVYKTIEKLQTGQPILQF